MISFIKGNIVSKNFDNIIIENNGIGYKINVSTSTIAKLPHEGEEATIHTYMQVTENFLGLFGFMSIDELSMFNMLITVSGVGPKGALAILATFTPSELMLHILSDDSKSLSQAKGLGTKTAQKIIIELKDKMKMTSVANSSEGDTVVAIGNDFDDALINCIDALISLGYSKTEAVRTTNKVFVQGMTVQDALKLALKEFNKF